MNRDRTTPSNIRGVARETCLRRVASAFIVWLDQVRDDGWLLNSVAGTALSDDFERRLLRAHRDDPSGRR